MRALVLCAGKGERLKPLTNSIAKPAIKILNVPIWSFPAFLVESLSPKEFHVNLHHQPESIISSFEHFGHFKCPVSFHHETDLLGSGGPLWHLKNSGSESLGEIILANGDGLILTKDPKVLVRMLDAHRKSKALATVLCMPLEGVGQKFSGVWVDGGKNIREIGTDIKSDDLEAYHYASFMILSPRIYDYLPKGPSNIFTDVLFPAGKKHELVQAFVSEDLIFFEVGNPEGLKAAETELKQMIANENFQTNLSDVLDRFSPGWRNSTPYFL